MLKDFSKLLYHCSKYSLKMTGTRFCHPSFLNTIWVCHISQAIMGEIKITIIIIIIKKTPQPFVHTSEQISWDRASAVRLAARPWQAGEAPLCSSGSSGHSTLNRSQQTTSYYQMQSWSTAQNKHLEEIQSSWLSHLLSRQWSCPCSDIFMTFVN